MNLAKQKIKLALKILSTEDKGILELIDSVFVQEEQKYKISKKDKKELDRLRKEYKSGKSKSFTMEEVREHAYSKLKKRNATPTKKKSNEKK